MNARKTPAYIPRSTPFSCCKTQHVDLLSGGRLFGLERLSGGVRPSFGLKKAELLNVPAAAEKMWLSAEGDLYVYSGGALYRSTGARNNFIQFATGFTSCPRLVSCEGAEGPYAIVSDGVRAVRLEDGSSQVSSCPPAIPHAFHYSRVFGVDPQDGCTVRWSQPGDAFGWEEGLNEAGYVRLNAARGKVLALIPYNNRLVAVRQYGLSVLRVYGEAEDFRVEVTDTDTSAICGDTAAVCAGRLLFFTADGLQAYGSGIESFAAEGLEGFSPSGDAAALGNTYFVCGTLGDEGVIACVGADGGVGYIAAEAACLCAAGRAFCISGGSLYEIVRGYAACSWQSPSDLGSGTVKFLESIYVDGTAEELTVSCDGLTRTFTDVNGRIYVGMSGKNFAFRAVCPQGLDGLRAYYAERR